MFGKSDDPIVKALMSLKQDLEALDTKVKSLYTYYRNLEKKIEENDPEDVKKDLDLIRTTVIPSLSRSIENLEGKIEEITKRLDRIEERLSKVEEKKISVQLVILPKDEAKRLIDKLIGD